jgi:hypothetical protein
MAITEMGLGGLAELLINKQLLMQNGFRDVERYHAACPAMKSKYL